jgi:hypothetical protein
MASAAMLAHFKELCVNFTYLDDGYFYSVTHSSPDEPPAIKRMGVSEMA